MFTLVEIYDKVRSMTIYVYLYIICGNHLQVVCLYYTFTYITKFSFHFVVGKNLKNFCFFSIHNVLPWLNPFGCFVYFYFYYVLVFVCLGSLAESLENCLERSDTQTFINETSSSYLFYFLGWGLEVAWFEKIELFYSKYPTYSFLI